MELETLIFVITSFSLGAALVSTFLINKFKANSSKKKMKVNNEEAIMGHYQTLLTINEDQKNTIQSIRQKLSMAQKKIAELEGYTPEEEEEPSIDIESLKPIATKLGINDLQLQQIVNSKEAKKFLSKKDNQQLISLALPFIANKLGGQNSLNASTVPEGYV